MGDLNIEVLIPERLAHWCDRIDLPEGATAALQTMAVQVRDDADLRAAFVAFYEKTVIGGGWHREWGPLPIEPAVDARCGEDTSLFYLLAYLSALPHTWEEYRRLGIGQDIFQATMLDIRLYSQDYYDDNGRWGFGLFPWIWRHLNAELFRLGRLQYMLLPFGAGVRAFRYKGKIGDGDAVPSPVLLADPETPLRADGYAWGAGRARDTDIPPESYETWRPVFETTAVGWRGHPIAREGWVHRSSAFLPAAEWQLILEPGDTILDVHIPRRDIFDAETCAASHAQAQDFFARVFPDRQPRALFCHTWMFSPQLQTLLPASSNIVRFQREFHLYPVPGTAAFLWNFVFGGRHPDPLTAPRDTTLRRAVLDHLARGGEIFELSGLLFHTPEEWGSGAGRHIRTGEGRCKGTDDSCSPH